MPIALEPQELRLFWLERDKDIPPSSRPVFECLAFTRRKRIQYNRIREEIAKMYDESASNNLRFDELIIEGIKLGVSGWRNFDKPFSIENLEEMLTDLELFELFKGWPSSFEMNNIDRKNLQSPLQSDAEKSAKDAPADNATNQNYQA